MDTTSNPTASTSAVPIAEAAVQAILQALSGMRFGQVTVIVQDGRVIQIDRTERHRLPAER